MHDLKIIRKDSGFFKKRISERNVEIDIKKLLDLDEKNRNLIQVKEKLEQEKKIISQKKDKTQFEKSKKLSFEIEKLINDQTKIKKQIDLILSSLPNLAQDDVPIGKDEKANKVINKIAFIVKFKNK